jgi:hypothetical protein
MRSLKLLEQVLPAPQFAANLWLVNEPEFAADLWLVNEPEVEPAPRANKPRSGRPVNPDAKYL